MIYIISKRSTNLILIKRLFITLKMLLMQYLQGINLFSVELKLFVDTLNACFNSFIKPKFLELDILKTQYYRKDNLIDRKKTICSICGFLLDVDQGGWIDFIAKSKYLFLRNMYSFDRLKKWTLIVKKNYLKLSKKC